MPSITGIHHVTALTADGQRNIDFYTGVLGLRLVKVTVNFDDPTSYHLYYGNERGEPGTAMTFFVWPGAAQGRLGISEVTATAFSVPERSLDFWKDRLAQHQVDAEGVTTRFGEDVLAAHDPDGLPFELVANTSDARQPWTGSDVPGEHAIRGFHSVTLTVDRLAPTAELLTETLGFRAAGETDERSRFSAGDIPGAGVGAGAIVDVLSTPGAARGSYGAGMVHHVALRTPDDAHQKAWRDMLIAQRYSVTPVMDRLYFHSIYFREPGGVLFEIATEGEGFAIDEPVESLGSSLRLPPMHEPMREQIEKSLPKLRLPSGAVVP